jgi:hypothetical protein
MSASDGGREAGGGGDIAASAPAPVRPPREGN